MHFNIHNFIYFCATVNRVQENFTVLLFSPFWTYSTLKILC